MVVFAYFYVEEEEERFEHQQGARPEEHRAGQEIDPPKVDLTRPKDSDKKASSTNEK
jgi:hypothetical protein